VFDEVNDGWTRWCISVIAALERLRQDWVGGQPVLYGEFKTAWATKLDLSQ
jgi:hypothetical protein